MKEEVWKDIIGYEGLYKVSNIGRIKKIIKYKNNAKEIKEQMLSPIKDKDFYWRIGLTKNKIRKHKYVHRLVAEAFIPNPNEYKYVNHKDQTPNKKNGVTANNNVENLEWCTIMYNNNYMNRNQLISDTQKNRVDLSKKILQYSLNGDFIKEWCSQKEIERKLGFKQSNISYACLDTTTHQMFGFMWLKKECDNYDIKIQSYINPNIKKIYQYDLNMKFINFWELGIKDICNKLNLTNSEMRKIKKCCNGKDNSCCGFIWSYEQLH